MKILFAVPYVPSRIRIRPYHFIKELTRHNKVHVVALGEPGGLQPCGTDEITAMCDSFHIIPHSKLKGYTQALLALPSPYPMCTSFCSSSLMQKTISKLIKQVHFDVIHVEHIRAAHFIPKSCCPPILFDSVDCISGLFRQMAASKQNLIKKLVMFNEAYCLKRYEPRTIKQFDHIIITSESEKEELIKLEPSLNISVVPNGVDTDYFTPLGNTKHPQRFVFGGKMSYEPNARACLWFAENVFPAIRNKCGEAEFLIVGSDPPKQVKELENIAGITVTGYVDDIRPYLDSASVAVTPMQIAVGIQNKILEAMAMELPVIAGSIACRALGPNCPGIIRADTASEYINAAIRLANNPALSLQIGKQGRSEVLKNYSWSSKIQKLEQIYSEMIADRTHDFIKETRRV